MERFLLFLGYFAGVVVIVILLVLAYIGYFFCKNLNW
jgi:hypothetical protein